MDGGRRVGAHRARRLGRRAQLARPRLRTRSRRGRARASRRASTPVEPGLDRSLIVRRPARPRKRPRRSGTGASTGSACWKRKAFRSTRTGASSGARSLGLNAGATWTLHPQWTLEAEVFLRSFDDVAIEEENFLYDPGEETFTSPVVLRTDESGSIAGSILAVSGTVSATSRLRAFWRYQDAIGGSSHFAETARTAPRHVARIACTTTPFRNFDVELALRGHSASEWPAYRDVSEPSAGRYDDRIPAWLAGGPRRAKVALGAAHSFRNRVSQRLRSGSAHASHRRERSAHRDRGTGAAASGLTRGDALCAALAATFVRGRRRSRRVAATNRRCAPRSPPRFPARRRARHPRPRSFLRSPRYWTSNARLQNSRPTRTMGSGGILVVCTRQSVSKSSSNVPKPPGNATSARARRMKCILRVAK